MNASKLMIAGLVVAAGLSLASEARGEDYQVSIGGGSSYLPSKSVDSLTDATGYARFDLEAGLQVLHVPILGHTEVALNWGSGAVSGSSFGRIESELNLNTVMALARVRRPVYRRVSGFAELGLGLQWGHLTLDDSASNSARSVEDWDKAAASSIGAGLDIQLTNSNGPFNLGLRTKLSYRAMTPLEFRATPMSEGSDELLLSTASADLGSVNTSGMAFAIGLVGHF
jgi:hypothetical protein